ncbi:MAG: transketolase [Anaerolineales bacterium]|nr:transketolase [Anaerolineales bacterium]
MQSKFSDIDQLAATTLRMLAADGVQQANSGHPGLPLGAADMAIVLWTRFLKHNPKDPQWFNRDRFVLSAGHGSMLLYGLLHLCGYPFTLEDLKNFRQWDSITPGHPEYDPERGIETTTGPLGQGFCTAVGIALAERMLAARFNQTSFSVVDHYTYVIASDGDLMEGVSHEAASLAGHWGLGKLIVLYDDNGISIDGPTSLSYSDDVPQRFEAYHWHVQSVNGHDMAAVEAAIRNAQVETGKPSLIACKTHIGYKSPLQDKSKVHGSPLGDEGLAKTKEAYGWPVEPRFLVPDEVRSYFEAVVEKGQKAQGLWESMLEDYRRVFPELAAQYEQIVSGELPAGWDSEMPSFSEDKPPATRVASGKVLNAISPRLPSLVGGSADLTPSNNTQPTDSKAVSKGDYSGPYIYFGIREHGMGGIMNGLALHGMRPYGGTFLVFSDYMRPAIRLAAMMKLPVIYVFTHDSIGLGEDGPTHQPVEHASALRCIPNLMVFRPADGNETISAWKTALERKDGPTALLLTRQNVPMVTPGDDSLKKGAYVLTEAGKPKPDAVIIATGSEISIALDAQKQLANEGIAVRVVSMPCAELFEKQAESYKNAVLPKDLPRVSIEAGVTLSWGRYMNGKGVIIGMDRFGASAPYKTLYEKLGFTAENIVKAVKSLI